MIGLRTTVIAALVFLTLSTTTTALHAQVRMRSGLWDNETTAHGKTGTVSKCLKPSDVAMLNGSAAVLRAEMEKASLKSGCTLKNFKLDGNTQTYTMVCSESTVLVETKFHEGDSAEDTMTFTGGGVNTVYQIKKRRTGDCKAGE